MSGSVNKVIIIGNLGHDPEIRTLQQSGDKVASFSLATSESWKDKATGERKTKTEWNRVAVFNQNLVKLAETYLRKGSKVYIEGQLETRKWEDKEGVTRYTTEVVLRPYRGEIMMLDSRRSDESYQEQPQDLHNAAGMPAASVPEDFSDEIPFMRHLDFVGA